MYFPFLIPKSGRKRSAHSRRRFIQSFPELAFLCRLHISRKEAYNHDEQIFPGASE